MKTILITGSSWFIWFHLAKRLLDEWNNVIWFDNENDYYDVTLKQARRKQLEEYPNFIFYKWDLSNLSEIEQVFQENQIDKVVNLAAQAWVRYFFHFLNYILWDKLMWNLITFYWKIKKYY